MIRPTGVTIVGIVAIVRGISEVFVGLLFELGSAFVARRAFGLPGFLLGMGAAIVGIFLILFGVLYFVAGLGLLKQQNWARVIVMALAGIGLVFTLLGGLPLFFFVRPRRLIAAAIDAAILWYLSQSHVKRAFLPATSAAPAP